MVDATNAELTPTEKPSDNLPSTERTPTQQKLVQEIINKLSGADAIQIAYDPAKGRTGQERFIVVDSEDSKTHIVLQAHAQGGGINPIGLERHDLVRVISLDESTMQTGIIDFVDRPDNLSYSSKSDIAEPEDLDYFRKTGGIDYLPGGGGVRPPVSEEETVALTKTLEKGHVNTELTQAALRHLEITWGAKRIKPQSQNPQITS